MELVFGKHSRELTQIHRGAARLTGTARTQIRSDHLGLWLVAPEQHEFFRLRLKIGSRDHFCPPLVVLFP